MSHPRFLGTIINSYIYEPEITRDIKGSGSSDDAFHYTTDKYLEIHGVKMLKY